MQVTDVRLRLADPKDSAKAYGSFTLDNDFVVCGIRVLTNKEGQLFVGFPCRKNTNGEFKDICFPMDSGIRQDITAVVISEYEKICEEQ